MPNAYITEVTKPRVEVVRIAPVDKERIEALAVLQQYPRGRITNTKDTPSMLGTGYMNNVVVAPMDDYNVGDDAVYTTENSKRKILHRITAKKPGFYYFKGTFNRNGDGWVPAKNVEGKIVHPKPKM
jgi:hypothetical protein